MLFVQLPPPLTSLLLYSNSQKGILDINKQNNKCEKRTSVFNDHLVQKRIDAVCTVTTKKGNLNIPFVLDFIQDDYIFCQ